MRALRWGVSRDGDESYPMMREREDVSWKCGSERSAFVNLTSQILQPNVKRSVR